MKPNFFFIFLLSGFGIVSGCKEKERQSIETPEITFTKEADLFFINSAGDTLATFAIEIAKTPYKKNTGLMYRKSLGEKQGMLFVYEGERTRNGFYMKNTYIPLDLIYLNAEKEIVDFNENTEPMNEQPLPSKAPSQYVLEVNAGTVENLGLVLGDAVVF